MKIVSLFDYAIAEAKNSYRRMADPGIRTGFTSPNRDQSNLFFTTSGLGMLSISQTIEKQALQAEDNAILYTGLQRLSRFKPQRERYRQIDEAGCAIELFGLDDYDIGRPLFSNLTVHALNNGNPALHGMEDFWFVILHQPDSISMALVCRELPADPAMPLKYKTSPRLIHRQFEGFWTFDKEITTRLAQTLEEATTSSKV